MTDLFTPPLYLVAVPTGRGKPVIEDCATTAEQRDKAKNMLLWWPDIALVQLCSRTPNGPICTHEARLRNGVPVIKAVDLTKQARVRKPRKANQTPFAGLG